MFRSRSSIRDPRSSAASAKLRSEGRRCCWPRSRSAVKWSSRVASSTSLAMTSPAPRRSSSKAQKPSIVPMSRQRMPASEGGHGSRSAVGRRSQPPGVTTPGATSIVCHQSSSATCARAASASVVAIRRRSYKTVDTFSPSPPEEMSDTVRDEFDMGELLREPTQGLRDYREEVGAPDLESALSVSAGWSVFAMQDGAVYNTYRVYPPSRIVAPLFSRLLELLPNKE